MNLTAVTTELRAYEDPNMKIKCEHARLKQNNKRIYIMLNATHSSWTSNTPKNSKQEMLFIASNAIRIANSNKPTDRIFSTGEKYRNIVISM